MSHTKVKICGLTNEEDVLNAVSLGADYLGFIQYPPSKRYVSPEKLKSLVSAAGGNVPVCGVFVNESLKHVNDICKECKLDYAQIHTEINEDYASSLYSKLIRVVRVKHEEDVKKAYDFKHYDFILFDAFVEGFGGEGVSFNWDVLKNTPKDFFLAGGLNIENVSKALSLVSPYAVDISSGIESMPGKKDYEKMKVFIERVRAH